MLFFQQEVLKEGLTLGERDEYEMFVDLQICIYICQPDINIKSSLKYIVCK